jgi:hypothetical protein
MTASLGRRHWWSEGNGKDNGKSNGKSSGKSNGKGNGKGQYGDSSLRSE